MTSPLKDFQIKVLDFAHTLPKFEPVHFDTEYMATVGEGGFSLHYRIQLIPLSV